MKLKQNKSRNWLFKGENEDSLRLIFRYCLGFLKIMLVAIYFAYTILLSFFTENLKKV